MLGEPMSKATTFGPAAASTASAACLGGGAAEWPRSTCTAAPNSDRSDVGGSSLAAGVKGVDQLSVCRERGVEGGAGGASLTESGAGEAPHREAARTSGHTQEVPMRYSGQTQDTPRRYP